MWQSLINLYRFLKNFLLLHYILFEAFIPIYYFILFLCFYHTVCDLYEDKRMTSEIQILILSKRPFIFISAQLRNFLEHLSFHFSFRALQHLLCQKKCLHKNSCSEFVSSKLTRVQTYQLIMKEFTYAVFRNFARQNTIKFYAQDRYRNHQKGVCRPIVSGNNLGLLTRAHDFKHCCIVFRLKYGGIIM